VTRSKKHWQNTPSIYCQCDEHDAGYIWGPPLHPVTCKRNADSSLSLAAVCVLSLQDQQVACMDACAAEYTAKVPKMRADCQAGMKQLGA
jgi:hypothetical protein